MASENLDPQDKAILDVMVAGKSDDDVMAEFEVDSAKCEQLRGHLLNNLPVEANMVSIGAEPVDGEVESSTANDENIPVAEEPIA